MRYHSSTAASAIALAAVLGVGCTYDFAEPFSGTTTGGTTGPGGGAAAGGAGGAAVVIEDCANGADDDADGLVDCEDDDCDSFACVDPAPDRWKGPVVVRRDATEPPTCDDAQGGSLAAGVGLKADPHTCSVCSCDPGQGGSCSAAITVWDGQSCAGAIEATLDVQGVCTLFNTSDTTSYGGGPTPIIATPASCPPTGGDVTKDTPSFVEHVTLCGVDAQLGACDDGEVCLAAPSADADVCIYADGDSPCPDGGAYVERSVVHQSIVDDRSCVPCACGAPLGAGCTATTNVYNTGTCTGGIIEQFDHDGSCNGYNGPQNVWYLQTVTGPGGSCIPGGGAPTGAATLTSPLTLCCARSDR